MKIVIDKNTIQPLSLLQGSFIFFKVINILNWSWWWILSPVLFMLGVIILVILFNAIYILILDIKLKLKGRG